jgi:regulator of replication initiation timing
MDERISELENNNAHLQACCEELQESNEHLKAENEVLRKENDNITYQYASVVKFIFDAMNETCNSKSYCFWFARKILSIVNFIP